MKRKNSKKSIQFKLKIENSDFFYNLLLSLLINSIVIYYKDYIFNESITFNHLDLWSIC